MAETTKKRNYTRKTAQEKQETKATEPKVQEEKPELPSTEQNFTKAQVQEMIAKAVAEALANAQPQKVEPAPQSDMVTVLYMDEVSQNSSLSLPGYGSMRPQSYLEVPKKEFGNKFMGIPIVRKFIDKRKLIIMDGLNKDERERWNCDYKEGEILDERTFDKMLDYPTPQLAEIFKNLCAEHQRFVACRMITAKEKGDNRISMEKAKTINDLSKKNDPAGMLKPVMEAFSAEITG